MQCTKQSTIICRNELLVYLYERGEIQHPGQILIILSYFVNSDYFAVARSHSQRKLYARITSKYDFVTESYKF